MSASMAWISESQCNFKVRYKKLTKKLCCYSQRRTLIQPVNLFKFNESNTNVASWPPLGFSDFFLWGWVKRKHWEKIV